MRVGDVITTTSIKAREPNAEFSFSAPKGQMFVMLLLGVTERYPPMNKPLPEHFPRFNPEGALRGLGWVPDDREGGWTLTRTRMPAPYVLEIAEDVFVAFDPTDDGSSILGAARTLEEAQKMQDHAMGSNAG